VTLPYAPKPGLTARFDATLADEIKLSVAAHRGSGRQVHDANVVATMLEHGIRRLLTFNAADFRRFARIIDIESIP